MHCYNRQEVHINFEDKNRPDSTHNQLSPNLLLAIISESVESLCRDDMDTLSLKDSKLSNAWFLRS